MRNAVKELIELMEDFDTETMQVDNLGLKFEGMSLDNVVLMENYNSNEKSISFVNGHLDDKHSMWLNSEDVTDEKSIKEFDELCEQLVELV